MPSASSFLSAPQRATLRSLAEPLLQGAPPSEESRDALIERCDRRLAKLPPHRRAQLGLALAVLGSRGAVLLAIGRPRRFDALTLPDQARCLTAWGDSRIPDVRAAFQSVRRLVLSVHYARPEVAAAVHYAGALSDRTPAVAWEGPAAALSETLSNASVPATDEPIVRLPLAASPLRPATRPASVHTAATVHGAVRRRADVVVIGTGAGGAVTAARLAEAGLEVVMLESGGWHAGTDLVADEATLMERLYADGALRSTDDGSVALVQGDTVGGSTTVNWMIMLRTPAYVLEQWARESGVYGMGPREMAPVFDQIEREVRSSVVPEDGHSANNRIVLDGARALGWRVSSARINAQQCVRCGDCGIGCRYDAKQSTLFTFIPRALAAGATLYADTAVSRIELLEREAHGAARGGTPPLKRVHGTMRRTDGAEASSVTIDAPIVVVAAGAIGTPALLQRSGLGGGGVGQWLRLHPTTAVFGHYDREIRCSTGIPLTTMCDEFIRWDGTEYGFWIETPPMLPSFTAAAMPGFGASHATRMTAFNQLGVLIGLTRDGAQRSTSSGRVEVNRRGELSIRYRLTPEDARRVQASLVAMARMHFAAGAHEVATMHTTPRVIRSVAEAETLAAGSVGPNRIALFSAHVNGTCRMGTDPAHSGATPEGERHGVRGLYITDGSLLPTALGVNPQETIMSVATVLAGRMIDRHGGLARH